MARVSRSLARWGSSKPFAEGLARFDLANCQAEVSLIAAARAGRVLEMKLPTGDGFDVTAQIRFTTTSVHFGGCRVWMICPRCCGRARVIFAGRGKIGCQRCLRLRYRSQCGDAKDCAHLAIAKIEKRLITRPGALSQAERGAVANVSPPLRSIRSSRCGVECRPVTGCRQATAPMRGLI